MTEVDLEQLALTWFQDSGWEYYHRLDIAPDGKEITRNKFLGGIKAEER